MGGWGVEGGGGGGTFRVVRCINIVLGSQSQLLLIIVLAAGLECDPDGHIHPVTGEIRADGHMLKVTC